MSMQRHICSCAVLLITLFGTTLRAAQQQHIALQRHVFQQHLASLSVLQTSQITHQKGIVIPCGGARQLASAYVTLLMIRNYFSCNLPVEVAYYGSHEMDDYHATLFQVGTRLLAVDSATICSVGQNDFFWECLQAVSATVLVDLSAITRLEYKAESPVGGYAAKAFAIIHSSFAEILCLDSDNIPLRDPALLFETASYQQHGNIFWSDPNINGLDPTVYKMFDMQPPWAEDATFLAAESGQILLNRFISLPGCLLHWQNGLCIHYLICWTLN